MQYLVLGYASQFPQLTGNIGNIALLKLAGELGLVPAELATQVRTAYREYRRLQHRFRLGGEPELTSAPLSKDKSEKFARIAADHLSNDRLSVLQLWDAVFRL